MLYGIAAMFRMLDRRFARGARPRLGAASRTAGVPTPIWLQTRSIATRNMAFCWQQTMWRLPTTYHLPFAGHAARL